MKIAPKNVMPVCYYPTTVVIVDDNQKFLKSLQLALSTDIPGIFFTSTSKALEFLNKRYRSSPFTERCLLKNPDSVHKNAYTVDSKKIINEIENPRRFEEIYTGIVDYAMPEKDGLTFCQEIDDDNIRMIMLTGEAKYSLAEKAFQEGIVSQFIRKDEDGVVETLLRYLHSNQQKRFEFLSYTILSLLSPKKLHKLMDLNLINFLKNIIDENRICEYYLLDKYGSYILFDKDANPSGIILRDDDDFEESIRVAEQFGASNEVIAELKDRRKLLFMTDESNLMGIDSEKWKNYLYPVSVFGSNKKYYYSRIEKLDSSSVNRKNILSFHEFLSSRQSSPY